MIQKRIKTKKFDKYLIFITGLPATFTLVACYTKWDDVVEVVTLVIVHPVRGKV